MIDIFISISSDDDGYKLINNGNVDDLYILWFMITNSNNSKNKIAQWLDYSS